MSQERNTFSKKKYTDDIQLSRDPCTNPVFIRSFGVTFYLNKYIYFSGSPKFCFLIQCSKYLISEVDFTMEPGCKHKF